MTRVGQVGLLNGVGMTFDWLDVASFALAGLSLVMLLRARKRLVGTTLLAPWAWCAAAVAAVEAGELLIALGSRSGPPIWGTSLRYAAAMATFCPAMAVFGAKRPQDSGWQWVVLTLWIVLALPAAQTVLYGMGSQVPPYAAWKMLIGALLLMEIVNFAVSRHRWAMGLFVGAQSALLLPHFVARLDVERESTVVALTLIAASTAVVNARREEGFNPADCDALWTRFVDWYGAFWTFRVMSLVNQTAAAGNWPVRLVPFGFVQLGPDTTAARVAALPTEAQTEIQLALRNTLRRFLSEDMLPGSDDIGSD